MSHYVSSLFISFHFNLNTIKRIRIVTSLMLVFLSGTHKFLLASSSLWPLSSWLLCLKRLSNRPGQIGANGCSCFDGCQPPEFLLLWFSFMTVAYFIHKKLQQVQSCFQNVFNYFCNWENNNNITKSTRPQFFQLCHGLKSLCHGLKLHFTQFSFHLSCVQTHQIFIFFCWLFVLTLMEPSHFNGCCTRVHTHRDMLQ